MLQRNPKYVIYRNPDGDFSWAYATDFNELKYYRCEDFAPAYLIYDEPIASHACRLYDPDMDTDDVSGIKNTLEPNSTYIILRQDPIGGYDLDMSVVFNASYNNIISRIEANTNNCIKCNQFHDYHDEFYFAHSSLHVFERPGDGTC